VIFTGKIKELLSVELDIPVSKMELHGWIHKNDALIQDTVSAFFRLIIIVDFVIIVCVHLFYHSVTVVLRRNL